MMMDAIEKLLRGFARQLPLVHFPSFVIGCGWAVETAFGGRPRLISSSRLNALSTLVSILLET